MKTKQIRSLGSSQHLYYFSCQHHYNIYIRLLCIHLSESTRQHANQLLVYFYSELTFHALLNNRGPKGKEPSKRGGGRTRKLYQKSYIIYETADLIDHSSVSEISPEHMSSSNFDTKLNDWIPSPFPFQQA